MRRNFAKEEGKNNSVNSDVFSNVHVYVQLANVVVPSINYNFDKEMTVLIQKQVIYNLCEYRMSLRKLCMHYI